jgi:outer membrane receptor for ferrienterochelin and colicin
MVEFQRTDRRSRTLQGMLAVACLAITLQVWPAGRVVRAAEPRDPVLDLSIEELMDVPITAASKATERAEDAPAIVTVIGRDQIRAYGARNLGEVLNRVTSALFLSANVLTPSSRSKSSTTSR